MIFIGKASSRKDMPGGGVREIMRKLGKIRKSRVLLMKNRGFHGKMRGFRGLWGKIGGY